MFSGVIASLGSGKEPDADWGGMERTDPFFVPRDIGREGLAPTFECRPFEDERAGRCPSMCSSTFDSRVDLEGGSGGGVPPCDGDSPPHNED